MNAPLTIGLWPLTWKDIFFLKIFPATNLHITPMIAGGLGTKYIHGQWDRTNLKIRDYILTTSAGAGLRWDIEPFFMKVLYQATWYRMTDTEDSYQTKGLYLPVWVHFLSLALHI